MYTNTAESLVMRRKAAQADSRTKCRQMFRKEFMNGIDELHLPSAISYAAPLRKLQLRYNKGAALGLKKREERGRGEEVFSC